MTTLQRTLYCLFVWLFLYCCLFFSQACFNFCDDPITYQHCYEITDFKLNNLKLDTTQFVAADNATAYDQFSLEVLFEMAPKTCYAPSSTWSFPAQAHALSCPQDEYIISPIPEISTLQLTSSQNYNANYPAGSNLFSLFPLQNFQGDSCLAWQDSLHLCLTPYEVVPRRATIFTQHANTIFVINEMPEPFPPYIYSREPGAKLLLRPEEAPEIEQDFQFTLNILFRDGTTLTRTSPTVRLTP